KEWLADLFWLLTQGHVLLFADDTIVLPRRRQPAVPAAPKEGEAKVAKKKKRRKRRKPRARRTKVVNHAKMVQTIKRMSAGRVMRLRGPEMIWRRRLERRGKIASLLED